jgi:hypothetical protein
LWLRVRLPCARLRVRAGAGLLTSALLLPVCAQLPCAHLRPKPTAKQRNRQRQRAETNRHPTEPTSFTILHIHASVYPLVAAAVTSATVLATSIAEWCLETIQKFLGNREDAVSGFREQIKRMGRRAPQSI